MILLNKFLTAFIPLFVAMDVIGGLPLYVSLVEGNTPTRRRRILFQGLVTAAAAGILFLLLGNAIFGFLGITVSDFKVAGGLILLVLAITDLLFEDKPERRSSDTVGIVPLGMPLLVGPAVLASLFMQLDLTGLAPTLLAFAVNLAIAFVIFRGSDHLMRMLGKGGTQAISKVASLLLAAFGVMMIRMGISEILIQAARH